MKKQKQAKGTVGHFFNEGPKASEKQDTFRMEGRTKARSWARAKVVVFFNEKANTSKRFDSFRKEGRTKARG